MISSGMKRIGTKLLLQVMLVIGVTVAGFNLAEVYSRRTEFSAALDLKAERVMRLLAFSLQEPLWNLHGEQIERILLTHMEDPDILSIRVSEGDTSVNFWGRVSNVSEPIDLKKEPEFFVQPENSFARQASITLFDEHLGSLEVRFSRQSVTSQMRKAFLSSVLFFVLLGTVLTISISSVMFRNVSAPVSLLSQVFQTVAAGNFEQKIDTSRPDEIGNLARSFAVLRDEIREKIATLNAEIEERKRAETALRASEQKYRTLYENITDGFVRVRGDGRIVEFNTAFQLMLGYPAENIYELGYVDITPGKWHQFEAEIVEQQIVPRGYSDVYEKEYIRRDGSVFPVELRTYLIENSQDEATGMWAFVRDITQRKQAEEALKESERKYRMLIENLPQKIFYKDTQSVYVTCNEHFAAALSLSVAEIRGKTDFDFFPDELAEKYRADDRRIIESKGTEEIVERYVEGGQEFIVQTVKTCTKNGAGEATGVLGIFWDISQQKQVEEDMSHLQSLLDNIVNSMPSMLVGVSLDGIINQWNRGAERMTGKIAGHVMGAKLTDVLPEFTREMASVQQAIRDRTPRKYEKVPRQNGGEQCFSDIIIYPLVNDRDVEGAVIRIDDVTERVRLEEMMVHAEKMVTVSGLAAGMAHEINNPLGVILQGGQSMMRRLSPELASNRLAAKECGVDLEAIHCYLEQRHILRYLEGMQEAGRRAAQIVANMLNFSRKSESKFAPHDVRKLLDQTLELAANDYDLKKKYDFRKIEIVRDYDENLPDLACEAAKLQQVFFNIVKNGAQAMSEAGRSHQRLHLRVKKDAERVRIEIQNNGPDIDDAIRQRIFEPFFTTKAPGIGTGLGLSVSYFIITENHRGTLSVESSPGKGCTFIITLPYLHNGLSSESSFA